MELLQVLAVVCMFSRMSWGHAGHHEGKPLEFSSEIHNKDHIIDHLQRQISTKPKDQMTDEELEFHYFKLHDYDNNNKLDGVEIGKALTHFHDESEPSSSTPQKAFSYQDVEIGLAVDEALNDDLDNDGYVEYYEFSLSQKLARSADPHLSRGAGTRADDDNGVEQGDGESPDTNTDTPAKPPSWKNIDLQDDLIRDLNNVVAHGSKPSVATGHGNSIDNIGQAKPPGWTPDAADDGANDQFSDPVEHIRRHQTKGVEERAQTHARRQESTNDPETDNRA